jgi:hypothetical protein
MNKTADRSDCEVPALIRKSYGRHGFFSGPTLQMAAALGGPAIAEFPLEQDWQAPIEGSPSAWKNRLHGIGHGVNRWLYLLATLRDPMGQQWRTENHEWLAQLADQTVQASITDPADALAFLFLDNGAPALCYWPPLLEQLSGPARQIHGGATELKRTLWTYLARLEPRTTVEMYVDVLRVTGDRRPGYELDLAIKLLRELPPARLGEVAEALTDEAKQIWGEDSDEARVLARLRTPEDQAHVLLEELRRPQASERRHNLAQWLVHEAPAHMRVELLTKDPDPELRLLAIPTLEAHPTPAHLALLEGLLQDSDERVRQAAQEARVNLRDLAESPPKKFSDIPADA